MTHPRARLIPVRLLSSRTCAPSKWPSQSPHRKSGPGSSALPWPLPPPNTSCHHMLIQGSHALPRSSVVCPRHPRTHGFRAETWPHHLTPQVCPSLLGMNAFLFDHSVVSVTFRAHLRLARWPNDRPSLRDARSMPTIDGACLPLPRHPRSPPSPHSEAGWNKGSPSPERRTQALHSLPPTSQGRPAQWAWRPSASG